MGRWDREELGEDGASSSDRARSEGLRPQNGEVITPAEVLPGLRSHGIMIPRSGSGGRDINRTP